MSEDQKLSELKLFTLDDLSVRWGRCGVDKLISYFEIDKLVIVAIPPHFEKVLEDLEAGQDYEHSYYRVDRSIISNTWINRDKSDDKLPRFKSAYNHDGEEVVFPKEVFITKDHFRVTLWEIERCEKKNRIPKDIVFSEVNPSKSDSEFWQSLCKKVDQAIELFPDYQKEMEEKKRRIQLTYINEWVQDKIDGDVTARDAELIKKVLTDVFELKS
jgi:hypothetical protein